MTYPPHTTDERLDKYYLMSRIVWQIGIIVIKTLYLMKLFLFWNCKYRGVSVAFQSEPPHSCPPPHRPWIISRNFRLEALWIKHISLPRGHRLPALQFTRSVLFLLRLRAVRLLEELRFLIFKRYIFFPTFIWRIILTVRHDLSSNWLNNHLDDILNTKVWTAAPQNDWEWSQEHKQAAK